MEHEAGPELDRLIAEKVMGWDGASPPGWRAASYSTQLSVAWLVVEAMREKGWSVELDVYSDGAVLDQGCYWAEFRIEMQGARTTAPTMPLAICRAALKALAAQAE